MNRWLILIASCAIVVGFFAALPITIKYPTGKNVGITSILLIFSVLGFYMFFKGWIKRDKPSSYGLRPVTEEDNQ